MDLLFLSKRIYLGEPQINEKESPPPPSELIHGGIIVDTEGIIRRVLRTPQAVNTYLYNTESEAVYDFGDMVLMPGLIDTNVNINEPGRKDWEGFMAATKAAAAGGFTTIIDRPTNNIPATTCVSALKTKINTARGKIYIDVGFWGGLVPENTDQLSPLLAAGVIGLQCTLCPSAPPVANEFNAVNLTQLNKAIAQITEIDDAVLAFHAELPPDIPLLANKEEPKRYESYLSTRPETMENAAVQLITNLATQQQNRTHFHIMNISSATVLPHIAMAKQTGAKLTAETCPHYLTLASEQITDCSTEYKTQPPIRSSSNQAPLWQALKSGGCLELISSNHSPATPGAKCLTYGRARGDFLNAWPGISSLQLSLSTVWTQCAAHGFGIADIHRLMCRNPVTLCGLSRFKGQIAEGYDADFCIWDPDEEFTVSTDDLYSTNKATPYMQQRLRGVIHATVVRGLHVYQKYEAFGQPLGKVLLRKCSKKIVKFVRM